MRRLLPVALVAAVAISAPLAAQGTCWQPRFPTSCRDYVVTDFAVGFWLTPTSDRFDRSLSRVVLNGGFGYMRAVGGRDAVGGTLDAMFYNRRSTYAGIEWLYPEVGAHVMARWDHWITDNLALRTGVGSPLGGQRLHGDIARPGLNAELGARWDGRLGIVLRMERHRLEHQVFAFPATPGFQFPLGNVGTLQHEISEVRTDWYVGLSTHGWTGLSGIGAVTFLVLLSNFTFRS